MIILNTLVKEYLQENFYLADNTKRMANQAFRYLILYCGNLPLDKIEFRHGEIFRNKMLEGGLSKNSVNLYLRATKPIFSWAVNRKLISQNPFKEVHQLKVTRQPVRIYSDLEILDMLKYVPTLQWKILIILGRWCGLRRGEALNLRKEDINNNFLMVQPKKRTDFSWEWEPKDREIRQIPISEKFATFLYNMPCNYITLNQRRYSYLLGLQELGLLDSNKRNCPIDNFRRTFKSIQQRAFGKNINRTFHDLRKSFVTNMLDALPPLFVAKMAGHSSVTVTNDYYYSAKDCQYELARETMQKGVGFALSV